MIDHYFSLAQAVPRIDSTYWIMLVSRILHVLGAIILVGGLFYIRAIILPVPNREGPGEGSSLDTEALLGGRRSAWAMWVGIATLLLLATGFWNYWQMISMHEKLASSYHMIAGIKILVGLTVFFLAALLAGRSAAAQMIRQKSRTWFTICLILAVLTVAFGSVLRSYPRIPKVDSSPGPTLIAP